MKHFFSIFVFLLLFFSFNAQEKINLSDTLPINDKIKHGKLNNGLTYYVMENPEPQNRAFLRLVVNVGSAFEEEDQKGLAHFCEHMAFNGTKNFPKKELINYLGSLGMRFGADLNAYTSFDETVYMLEIPLDSAGFLDKGLLVLYDWACNVSYENEEVEKERGIIHEEWRLGKGAYERIRRETYPVIFYNSKYAQRIPIGDTAVFDNCPPDNLRRFYNDWYRPDLQAVIAVGDFDASSVENKIIEMFSKIPATNNPKEHKYPEIPNHSKTLVKVATDKEAPRIYINYYFKHDLFVPKTFADYRKLIVSDIVSNIFKMRLNEIAEQKDAPFSYTSANYHHFMGEMSSFSVFAVSKTDKTAKSIKVIEQELQRVVKFGFTENELERTKKVLISEAKKEYDERFKTNSNNWVWQIHSNFKVSKSPLLSKKMYYDFLNQVLPTISIKEVNTSAKNLITDDNKVITVSAPDIDLPTEDSIYNIIKKVKKQELNPYKDVVIDKPLISKNIESGKINNRKEDKITDSKIITLNNGVKVVYKSTDFKDNEIKLKAFSFGGYSLYPLKDNSSARYCDMIATYNGIGNYNKVELTKFMADKNFSLRPYVGLNTEGFTGSSTIDDFEYLLKMIYLYFTEPVFEQNAFDVFIEKQKSIIENQNNDPRAVWYDSISTCLNNNSPYTEPLNMENLNEIDNKKAEQIFNERFADPGSFTFVFVGSIDSVNFESLIEKYLGALPKADNNENYKDLGIRYPKETKKVTAYKGTDSKSMVYTLLTGKAKYNTENLIALTALSYIMTDTLIDQVREAKRWTYSISAHSNFKKIPEPEYSLSVFYSCSPDKVDSINQEIMDLSKRLAMFEISDTELENTKQKLKRKHETDLRSNKYWLSKLSEIYIVGCKPDFVSDYFDIVDNLTKNDIKKAAQKFFDDDYISIILKPENEK